MTDLLIRDVPEAVLSAIDERAKRLGLSRTEYLRRALAREASALPMEVTQQDLHVFSRRVADLGDPDAMDRAWR